MFVGISAKDYAVERKNVLKKILKFDTSENCYFPEHEFLKRCAWRYEPSIDLVLPYSYDADKSLSASTLSTVEPDSEKLKDGVVKCGIADIQPDSERCLRKKEMKSHRTLFSQQRTVVFCQCSGVGCNQKLWTKEKNEQALDERNYDKVGYSIHIST